MADRGHTINNRVVCWSNHIGLNPRGGGLLGLGSSTVYHFKTHLTVFAVAM